MKIEEIWDSLRRTGSAAQRRLDERHPCDLYADFEPPDQLGLVAICDGRPTPPRPMRAISVEVGQRADGRWSLRIALQQPALAPVFAALCRDISTATASGVTPATLAAAVLARLNRWRSLLERDSAGLDSATLRGLIGELAVLMWRVLPQTSPLAAVEAWKGPLGAAQDFMLPDGGRLEVKAVEWDATTARINGLSQLDAGQDALTLAVVRLQTTSGSAIHALSATRMVALARDAVRADPEALELLDDRLALLGWHDHPSHDELAVRVLAIHAHPVSGSFPRLTAATVPSGISDVEYCAALPPSGFDEWPVPA